MSNDPSTTTSSIAGDTTKATTDDNISPATTIPEDTTTLTTTADSKASTSLDSSTTSSKSQAAAFQSLSTILPSFSPTSHTTARSLLHDPHTSSAISSLLKQPDSGAGDNNLCRWLYDTFQSSDPDLQLLVLRFLPLVAGLYLSRVPLRIPLAGFEAVLLALYAHETTARGGQSVTVSVPDLSHTSLYHETKSAAVKSNATGLNLAVISPSLEPHGTIRSTRRARIVGVALELYYTKIYEMPVESKMDFCEFCMVWAGQDGEMYKQVVEKSSGNNTIEANKEQQKEEEKEESSARNSNNKEGMRRVPLPCELMQPVLRILGHCLLCPNQNKKLTDKASEACRSLYARSMHDVNPKAILATGSLLRLANMAFDSPNQDGFDPTELPKSSVITL
ncbi:uncharacterized protein LOC126795657 [Argentina anserina]|uniref:uncharacterized protein LOC126795657 n=1 Tax=Argentina anserina TaxID=57926 RepID=UPI0021763BE6|nr:uncharacterized protein LOC126795657 [Potentilla anserina]